jgi:hypothetical protein
MILASFNAYNGEDIWGLESNVVEFLVAFRALGISRDDILWDTLKLFLCEGNYAL